MPKPKSRQPGFEQTMDQLEKIVAQLESGDLPLESALELFEEGVGLARRCQVQLEEAERKVELLLRERGEIKVVPFDETKPPPESDEGEVEEEEGEDTDDDDDDDSVPF